MTEAEEIRAAFILDSMVDAGMQIWVDAADGLWMQYPRGMAPALASQFSRLVTDNKDLLVERIKLEAGRREIES